MYLGSRDLRVLSMCCNNFHSVILGCDFSLNWIFHVFNFVLIVLLLFIIKVKFEYIPY